MATVFREEVVFLYGNDRAGGNKNPLGIPKTCGISMQGPDSCGGGKRLGASGAIRVASWALNAINPN